MGYSRESSRGSFPSVLKEPRLRTKMKHPFVIIDHDPNTQESIQLMLENKSNFICVGVAEEETKGLDIILERMPDLVFLEVETPGQLAGTTQFQLMNELRKYLKKLPQFIVVTRTSNYAIEAIRHGVLDYLLKPLDSNLLRRALLRMQNDHFVQPDTTLCFKSYGDYKFIDSDEVMYLKADNNTTDFIMSNGSIVGAFKSLKYFEDSLPPNFVRIHKSYIVNTNFISRIHFGKSRCVIKNSNNFIPFSKSYRTNVEFIKNDLFRRSMIMA